MISRRDFIFTIGYEGNAAVVDGALKKRFGALSTEQLAEQQLFKQAVCSAVYERSSKSSGNGNEQALQRVLEIYNSKNEKQIGSVEELQRLFGVYAVPEGIAKVTVV